MKQEKTSESNLFNSPKSCDGALEIVPAVNVFGVRVHDISLDQMLEITLCYVKKKEKKVISNVNIYALNIAYTTPWYRDFLNQSAIVFCDGFGVMLGTMFLGSALHHRYTPPDWIRLLIQETKITPLRLFFLGGRPGVAEKAAKVLTDQYPHLEIGHQHGFFDKRVDNRENINVVEQINRFQPHILMVGFGMPLQEKWIMENACHLEANVIFPVGALFDFISGNIIRAPRWMTDHGLEWLGRLIVEPKRLWTRYAIGNPLFFLRILEQRFGKYILKNDH